MTDPAITRQLGERTAPGSVAVWAERATRLGVAYLAALVIFGVPLLLLRAAVPQRAGLAVLVATAFAVAALAVLIRGTPSVIVPLAATWRTMERAGSGGLWVWVMVGLILRLAWVAAFPATPASDGATYLDLATRLASGREYEMEGTRAYWPPGYPLWLGAWIVAVGDARLAVVASNLVLFCVGSFGCWHAARALAGLAAARLALPILVLWPNYIAYAGSPEKEQFLIALLPWLVLLAYRAATRQHAGYWAGAGALVGLAALVQPSLQLLPLALLGFGLVAAPRRGRAALGASLAILAMAAVIAPWTWRNYVVLGAVVPIATNGGSNLYRANNPLATGGYTRQGEVDLSPLPELESDREGRRLAVQWITGNPAQFVRLALWKQVLFAGDDAAGVYTSVKLGRGSESAVVYAFWKLAANVYWVAFWSAMLALVVHAWRRCVDDPVAPLLPALFVLYLFGLHSVFESSGKYHVPLIGILPVLLAAYADAAFRAHQP